MAIIHESIHSMHSHMQKNIWIFVFKPKCRFDLWQREYPWCSLYIPNWTVNKKAFNLYSFFFFLRERQLHIYCSSNSCSCCCCCRCSSSSSCPCCCCCCCCCGAFLWKLKNHNASKWLQHDYPLCLLPTLLPLAALCHVQLQQQHWGGRGQGPWHLKVPAPAAVACFLYFLHTFLSRG